MPSKLIHQVITVTIIFSFLLALMILPTNAQAALELISVNPSIISNLQANTITITGNDFASGSIASLDGYGSLSTSYFSNTTLLALVPGGISTGYYTLTVTNPDTSTASLPNALQVIASNPTAAITQTSEPLNGYERPVLVVDSYDISQETISPGDHFTLNVTLYNAGQHYARNAVATFTPGDLIPRNTGGVIAVGEIAPGNHMDFSQPFLLGTDVWGYVASINMVLTYADENGALFNETFVVSLPVFHPYSSSSTATPTPTVTSTPSVKPQLVITNYSTDVSPLQPGNIFNLSLTIKNMGATTARRVTMIVGGGSSISGGDGGTQQPGGISGASGEFTNFAPIGSSNVQSLGEFPSGSTVSAIQPLIVNTSTSPGAYPLKISFVYVDDQNHSFTDDQVITLLVYRLPLVDINFYQELPPIFTGQMNTLPLQVVNMGRNSIVLGNLRVNASTGQFSNNSILVGTLESGGYFTLDAMYMPDQPGLVDLLLTIDYTNDFNQPQVITKTISVDVIEQPIIEPPINNGTNGGEVIPEKPETFLQKIWRFVLGLIGLDSGTTTTQPPSGITPIETAAPEKPIIVPAQPIKGP
jgi:hypothetical protein